PAKAPPPLVLLPKADTSLDWAEEECPEKRPEGGPQPPAGLWGAGLVQSSLGALPMDWYVLGLEQGKSHLPQPLRAEGLPEVEFLRSKRLAFLQRWHLPVPDPDHGYHSLEEEQQQQHGGVRRETGEQRGHPGDLEQPEDAGRQPGGVPEEPKGLRDAAEEEEEALAEEEGEDSETEQNFSVSSRPVCANKLIHYIIGGVSSGEESEDEEEWDDDDDDDDDGFDSEELPSDSDAGSQDGERLHLWNSFYSLDPYNPQNFTATIQTSSSEPGKGMSDLEEEEEEEEEEDSWAESCEGSPSSEEDEWDCDSADEAENLKLWNSFCSSDDPYNPLNFTAAFQPAEKKGTPGFRGAERPSCVSSERLAVCRAQLEKHNCGVTDLGQRGLLAGEKTANSKRKKVTFLEKVTEYYISSEEDRKGPWEEMARDGCRFQKRIQETEEAIGYCLSTEHRQRVFHRLQEFHSQRTEPF
ncbi:PR15B phosphatase, partial [Notiomystis cincta]|nr:PR15B phosphatase [Notiomystis cincta]